MAEGSEAGTDFTDWLTLYGSRYAVAALVLIVVAAVVATLVVTSVVPPANADAMLYLFSAFVGGNFTLITVVLSINQLVLSQQLQAPNEIRSEIEATIEYRRNVEGVTGVDVLPVVPRAFLRRLLESTRQHAQALGGLVARTGRPDLERDVDEVVEAVTASADRADVLLTGDGGDEEIESDRRGADDPSGMGIFAVLAVLLSTNYAAQLRDAARIRADHGDALREAESVALDELTDALRGLDVARQYFRTIYVQEELARLSRLLLYVGIPAIVAAALLLPVYRTPGVPTVPRWTLGPLFTLGVVVSLAPIAVLFAFVLRLTVVSQRTVAVTPFTTPRQEHPGESGQEGSDGDDQDADDESDEGAESSPGESDSPDRPEVPGEE
ncbi:hypothetical protein [Natronoarchaeum rubrum]|uniref:hypothetical protein n=1 Tax=Natronoarchaeum rubrum TaxID=755311 RepID=UPI002113712C|nr:hypothetical protein [Natronoarchaeum rubrum]